MKIERLKQILKSKAFKELGKFMKGQTIDVEGGIYEDDFMKWFYKMEVTD
jgi:hypothetical protein